MSTGIQYESERELFQQIAGGSETAFEAIYRLYVPQLASFLHKFSLSMKEEDEIIQETFLRLWLQRDKLSSVDFPKAWVFRITSNILFNYIKRNIKGEQVLDIISSSSATAYNDVEDTVQVRQLMQAIANAVEQLSPQRKKIYELSRNEGMTIQEIATRLGLSVSTVKNTLTTTLQLVREFLHERGFDITYFLLMILSTPHLQNILDPNCPL